MTPLTARNLIANTEARLLAAEHVFAADRLAICDLNSTRAMLRRVRWWKAQPEGAVALALGDLGPNGRGPLVDHLCSLAERLQIRRRAA